MHKAFKGKLFFPRMVKLVLFPQWFLTPDTLIDFFSFIVLFLFAIISLKYYKLVKNRKFLHLGLAFLLIGLGELTRIIMNLGLYYNLRSTYEIGRIIVTTNIVSSVDIIYFTGFFINRFLVMLGFYFVYYSTKKHKHELEHLLVLYFITITSIFASGVDYIFNITVTVLLALIFVNYNSIYRKTKSKNTKILAYGFFILLISYLLITLSKISSNIYIFANLLQLISYTLFLYLIIKIYKHDEDKKFSKIQNLKRLEYGKKK